jgi:sugar transferase EpsL
LADYTDQQRRMFEVRPGITGWAQTHGRKDVEWHKRIELNVWYVDHVSFWLDIKILFMTVFKVLTNADNENKGATVQTETKTEEAPQEPVQKVTCLLIPSAFMKG